MVLKTDGEDKWDGKYTNEEVIDIVEKKSSLMEMIKGRR